MKKKLTILINSMAGGGAERIVSILLNNLESEFDISLVLLDKDISYDIKTSIPIYCLVKNNSIYQSSIMQFLTLPFLAFRFYRFCQKYNTDISLSFLSRSNYINVLSKILFRAKVKTVISERGTPSLYYGYNNFSSKVNQFLIRHLYLHADRIITNSKGNKDDLIKNFFIDTNIHTVYNPIDIQKIKKVSSDPIKNDTKNFTFITVGRLDQGKNHEMMIRAFSKIASTKMQLFILGDGILKVYLQELINKLNMNDNIFLLGFDSNPYKYLTQSDCFLFSSNYEGFPNVLIEALACQLAVISTDCKSGPREILAPRSDVNKVLEDEIEVAEFGILTPIKNQEKFEEAMMLMLNKGELKNQYQQRAEQRLKEFNINKIIEKFKEVICVE